MRGNILNTQFSLNQDIRKSLHVKIKVVVLKLKVMASNQTIFLVYPRVSKSEEKLNWRQNQ